MSEITPERVREAVKILIMGILMILFFVLVFATLGCKTIETVYERVEVPQPYWDPPKNIKEAPPKPMLQAGDISREEAEANPKVALQAVGRDLDAALGWGEHLSFLYAELVKRVQSEPAVTPPSSSDSDSPGD